MVIKATLNSPKDLEAINKRKKLEKRFKDYPEIADTYKNMLNECTENVTMTNNTSCNRFHENFQGCLTKYKTAFNRYNISEDIRTLVTKSSEVHCVHVAWDKYIRGNNNEIALKLTDGTYVDDYNQHYDIFLEECKDDSMNYPLTEC
ncbi:hypothetical protein NEOKW01_0393 [Nematocida sp. AWRm80]|nr:hypothetical protein NEOKW01_0393 [Nematocida sp. AWRm80]